MDFEFDPKKSLANLQKHGVSFAEVEPVFYDGFALTREDRDVSGEARFVTVGADALGRLVAVCWTQRGDCIRLISARFATSTERKSYES
ncbi:MAG: BrnT family toxin [Gallionella sp.]|nr:BrnT family toxin [Gallionella sp.]